MTVDEATQWADENEYNVVHTFSKELPTPITSVWNCNLTLVNSERGRSQGHFINTVDGLIIQLNSSTDIARAEFKAICENPSDYNIDSKYKWLGLYRVVKHNLPKHILRDAMIDLQYINEN